MKFKMLKAAFAGLVLTVSGFANSAPITYAGSNTVLANCIPFGCPDSYGPNMGFIYQNIDAFTLNVGDTIAFDTGITNDLELSFDLSLGATTVNGGTTVDGNGFTFISSLGSNYFGDSIVGNYDLVFTATSLFTFNGGGLIVNFLNTNGTVNDNTSEQNLVYSTDSSYAVSRYYFGSTVGDMTRGDSFAVGNMRISTSVSAPSTLAILALGLIGLGARRFKK